MNELECNMAYGTFQLYKQLFNPFKPNVAFYIETSHFYCDSNQITGFYIKCITGLKWVKRETLFLLE